MFPLPSSTPLSSYGGVNNPPSKHPAARYVRTLPMLAGACTIRSFVELWTMCNFRSEKFYQDREKQNEERNLMLLKKSNNDDDEKDEKEEEDINLIEQRQIKLKRTRKGKRDGQFTMKELPFAVIVKVSQFLKHNPILRFGHSSFHLGYIKKYAFKLDIVEDMEFDINRVVSFYLRASIDGKVVEHSRFFLNPDMTIGISFEPTTSSALSSSSSSSSQQQQQRLERQKHLFKTGLAENEKDEELIKEVVFFRTPGVMLFDHRFLEMKGVMCDGTKVDRFGSKWTLEGNRI